MNKYAEYKALYKSLIKEAFLGFGEYDDTPEKIHAGLGAIAGGLAGGAAGYGYGGTKAKAGIGALLGALTLGGLGHIGTSVERKNQKLIYGKDLYKEIYETLGLM